MMKIIPMDIRKIIVADHKHGMEIKAISKAARVSESAIYRLLQKKRKTGTIEPSYQGSGSQSEVTAEKLAKWKRW
jgi:transposase